MDLNFYSELSDGCAQNVDSEFLDTQTYGGYSEENKFTEGGDSYLAISGGGHPFLSAETFHTPSLGDEVFEIPPISLDPDPTLSISDAVSHFGPGGASGSRSLVSNLVVEANDPSFASTFVNSGSQGLQQLNLGAMGQAGGGALLSSSALELGNSSGSHFSSSSPMTIDVQLGDISHSLLGSSHLSTINPSELALGLGGDNIGHPSGTSEQPLSATPSPAGSLQDEDMDDFKRCVLVDTPLYLTSSLSHMSSHPTPTSSVSPATSRRGGGKPASLASVTGAVGPKKVRKKKDPNEPQKPVSAYALFFRDTQAAIKGQNPNASFGEVSKIVASMWDSLAEGQKQVYKRKTEAAKREYLKALAAYRENQLIQPANDEMETAPSPPPPPPPPAVSVTPTAFPFAGHQAVRLPTSSLEENTITNICASNIILDVPEMTTRSRTGANKPPAPTVALPPSPTITKIIIPKHMLQAGGQVVTVLQGGVCALTPTLVVSGASRQPPPLQQMQSAPPPPRLQQMAPAPPPLQAKPREGSGTPGLPVSIAATPPPPLQIKIVPASLQGKEVLPIIVPNTVSLSSTATGQSAPGMSVQLVNSADALGNTEDDEVTEVLHSEEEEMEVNGSGDASAMRSVCVRTGCNNPAVESCDWDKEYCSNECVATHCSTIFKAWCSIRSQTMGVVK
ncbi:epidermal Langerhans cell protein LCP1-like isoform X2 [Gasterosteus aculeatus]|uniref:TOX high mobility group box family member 4-A isoform X2 n=1 Tax=Gasterosteus aculeatus aculeatus TaxID=481459 RepID=UPI001A9994A8|nr:TOX high mobility group box family member 4-A isoform X2 [Gasterosteus aculeatus aculeatus]